LRPVLQPRERKLRVGLLLDGMTVSSWQWKMLEKIRFGDFAEICALIVSSGEERSVRTGRNSFSDFVSERNHLVDSGVRKILTTIYSGFLQRKPKVPSPEERRPVAELLSDVPVLHVRPIRSKRSDRFTADDLQRMRAFEPDVLVRLGARILRGDVLDLAKYGVWSYHHGDNRINRGGPPGFWEAMQGWPEIGSVLQILGDDLDNGTVLCRSYSCMGPYATQDNWRRHVWKSASFLPRKLSELHESGSQEFFLRVDAQNAHPHMYSRRLYRRPGNAELAGLVGRKLIEKTRDRLRAWRYMEQWILLYDLRPELSTSLWRYRRIIPPKDRYWADPHVVARDGRYYIFIEEHILGKKAHIAVIEMDDRGNHGEPTVVLKRPYHLSYPFVFEHEGRFYMIPETAENSAIELYRCVEFPHVWEFQETLIDNISARDSTLVRYNGKYWLFAAVAENPGGSTHDELFVYHSDQPFGAKWIPHPMNPVLSDCKSARPGGALFIIGDRLYRPSQNCSRYYGFGFNLAHVETLNEREYRETIVSRVEPDWADDLLGTHTFNRAGALNVADAFIRRRR